MTGSTTYLANAEGCINAATTAAAATVPIDDDNAAIDNEADNATIEAIIVSGLDAISAASYDARMRKRERAIMPDEVTTTPSMQPPPPPPGPSPPMPSSRSRRTVKPIDLRVCLYNRYGEASHHQKNDSNAFVMPRRNNDTVASTKMTPNNMGMCIDV